MSANTEQILFSGQVQGVGFRWTTERIAAGLPVNGFVRNLRDGRVEVIVSGTPDSVQRLIDGLYMEYGGGISAVERRTIEVPGHFTGFVIRR